jgi:anti-sigma B factor antagonist
LPRPDNRNSRQGALSVQVEDDGDIRTIELQGELDLANAALFERELDDALADGSCQVNVDLRRLEFIDSTGIAILVTALRHVNATEKLRFLLSREPGVARVLQMTGVEERLPLADGAALDGTVSASNGG